MFRLLFHPQSQSVGASRMGNVTDVDQLREAQAKVSQMAFRTLNSVVRPAVLAGAGNPLPIGGGAVVLEVTGRVSGQPRQVPLLAARAGSRLVVSTVRSDSQWLKNIEANPQVVVHLYGKRRTGTASVNRGQLNTVAITLD
jgi:deazaflavin-dependent oxidoreductase (nitroreductase family)